MRVAWFSPFSRSSAIGQYSAIVVERMAQEAEIFLFAPDLKSREEAWIPGMPLVLLASASQKEIDRRRGECDICVYNLGDHLGFHGDIYEQAKRAPGLVILHDLVMHHFFAGYYWERMKEKNTYIRELTFSHGAAGTRLGQSMVAGQSGDAWDRHVMLEFNMARSAIHGAYGVVVHSDFARAALANVVEAPIQRIRFPQPMISRRSHEKERQASPSPNSKVRFLTVGVVNPNKMVLEVAQMFALSSRLREGALYDVIGPLSHDPYRQQLEITLLERGLSGTVTLLGYQSGAALEEHLANCDVVVNLRNPHFGESSWSLVEALYLGKPTLVWAHGFYDEVPDDVVVKIRTVEELRPALERLAEDVQWRSAIGARAFEYARSTFTTDQYCEHLLDFIATTRYNTPALQLADRMADRLLEVEADRAEPAAIERVIEEIARLACPDGAG